jgi:hypothetical protein
MPVSCRAAEVLCAPVSPSTALLSLPPHLAWSGALQMRTARLRERGPSWRVCPLIKTCRQAAASATAASAALALLSMPAGLPGLLAGGHGGLGAALLLVHC